MRRSAAKPPRGELTHSEALASHRDQAPLCPSLAVASTGRALAAVQRGFSLRLSICARRSSEHDRLKYRLAVSTLPAGRGARPSRTARWWRSGRLHGSSHPEDEAPGSAQDPAERLRLPSHTAPSRRLRYCACGPQAWAKQVLTPKSEVSSCTDRSIAPVVDSCFT